MVKINFSKIDDAKGMLLESGRYLFQIADITERKTKTDAEMWGLKLECITKGQEGKTVYDNLVFTEKALPRVKLACGSMGIDISGELDLTTTMLIGKKVLADVEQEEYEGNDGKMRKRNIIPYAGYHAILSKTAPKATNAVGKPSLPSASDIETEQDKRDEDEANGDPGYPDELPF